jgi:uncharacterized protein YdhG (YjbR/CyaY superfamily)
MQKTDFRPLIDAYISGFPEHVQVILQKIRQVVTTAAPDATEVISYRMPALRQGGMLIYYAAFQHHIGVYPPVRGDADLMAAVAPWAGEKGNLRLPYDEEIPYALIDRIVRYRVQQEQKKGK